MDLLEPQVGLVAAAPSAPLELKVLWRFPFVSSFRLHLIVCTQGKTQEDGQHSPCWNVFLASIAFPAV